jgi:hypothetical protein
MRRLLAFLLAISICTSALAIEYPTVNLPLALRQHNWRGMRGEGSCVHASMVMLLRWQGRHQTAEWWRKHYGDGEWSGRLSRRLTQAGIRFAVTESSDVKFLEWACQTRRGAGVVVSGGAHMVCLVHLDKERAGILDNNDIKRILWMPRKAFLAEWKRSGGWAVTPVYSPAPPLPH